jgi:hypothetical protein
MIYPAIIWGDEVHTAVGKITVQRQQEKGRGLGCTVQYIQYHSEYDMAPTKYTGYII